MKPAARIRLESIKAPRLKGEKTRDYRDRVRKIQTHADLTAYVASLVLDGGHAEAKLRGENHG